MSIVNNCYNSLFSNVTLADCLKELDSPYNLLAVGGASFVITAIATACIIKINRRNAYHSGLRQLSDVLSIVEYNKRQQPDPRTRMVRSVYSIDDVPVSQRIYSSRMSEINAREAALDQMPQRDSDEPAVPWRNVAETFRLDGRVTRTSIGCPHRK